MTANVLFIRANPALNYQSLSHLSLTNCLNKADHLPCDIISYGDKLSSKTFAPYPFIIQEDLIESISKFSVSKNKKTDPVQKIIDVQTVENHKKDMLELSSCY